MIPKSPELVDSCEGTAAALHSIDREVNDRKTKLDANSSKEDRTDGLPRRTGDDLHRMLPPERGVVQHERLSVATSN